MSITLDEYTLLKNKNLLPVTDIINVNSIRIITRLVEKELGKKLNKGDVRALIQYIKNNSNKRDISGLSTELRQQIIAYDFVKNYDNLYFKDNPIDLRESYYKREILDEQGLAKLLNAQNISDNRISTIELNNNLGEECEDIGNVDYSGEPNLNIPSIPSSFTIQGSTATTGGYDLTGDTSKKDDMRNAYVVIDSRYRSVEQSNLVTLDSFSFNFTNSPIALTDGNIRYIGEIKDILEIEIFEFYLPNNDQSDEYYDNITLLIEEMQSQSFINNGENIRYHFAFKTKVQTYRMELIPLNKIFKFFKPISQIERMNLIFRNPFEKITFKMDRFNLAPIGDGAGFLTNPMSFETLDTAGNPIQHNIQSGDLVYIDGIGTEDIDVEVSEQVNQKSGHRATRITDTIFSIPIDAGGISFDRFNDIITTFGALLVTTGGVEYYLTIPSAVYLTTSDLASALQTVLQTASGTYPGVPSFTVTVSNDTLIITDTAAVAPPGRIIDFNLPNSAGSMLGFGKSILIFNNTIPGTTNVKTGSSVDFTLASTKGPHLVIIGANRVLIHMRVGYIE